MNEISPTDVIELLVLVEYVPYIRSGGGMAVLPEGSRPLVTLYPSAFPRHPAMRRDELSSVGI